MLKIKYTEYVTSKKVKETMEIKNDWSTGMAKTKLRFAGRIMRGSSDELVQLVLKGYRGEENPSNPRRKWGDNIIKWTDYGSLVMAKRSENKLLWQIMVHNLRLRDSD